MCTHYVYMYMSLKKFGPPQYQTSSYSTVYRPIAVGVVDDVIISEAAMLVDS